MGLIQAGMVAAQTVLADQWKEYFICDALSEEVLVARGMKQTGKGSNTKGSPEVITQGSAIVVNEGQCMIIVDQGEIVEVSAQPGVFTYDASAEPTIFSGNLGESIKKSWETFKRRFTYGGDTARSQRVYYFNTKRIYDNKYGTASPIPFRVVDKHIGLDIDVELRCNGTYEFQMTDPILFYKQYSGNIVDTFERAEIANQLKSDLLTTLQPALAEISEKGVRYSAVPAHADDLQEIMNRMLSKSWGERYGLQLTNITFNSFRIAEEDEKRIKELQLNAGLTNPALAAAQLVGAQAQAMQSAASNESAGSMMAFAGMNMAAQAGGMNPNQLYSMAAQQQTQQAAAQQPAPQQSAPQAQGTSWQCGCGTTNSGNFCSNCGTPKPSTQWTCGCGTTNEGNFCSNCGKPKG